MCRSRAIGTDPHNVNGLKKGTTRTMSDILKASRPKGRSRRPKTYDEERTCAGTDCTTKLSKYNRAEFCHNHRPVRYPRLRGVLTSEE